MDRKRFGQRWYRTGDWPMALKLILHTGGIAAALAVGLTAMGYIQAAQGLSERAEAALSSDALVVTTAIDDWNAQHLTSLQSLARLPAVARLLSGKPDAMVLEDQETAGESLSALGAPGQNVESVVLIGASCKVILSNRVDDVGKDVGLDEDVRTAIVEGRPSISDVISSRESYQPVIFHTAPVLDISGQTLGAVRLRSSVAAIERVVQQAENRTGAGAMGTLLDENGLVVVDSLMPDWLLRPAVALGPDAFDRLAGRGTWSDKPPPSPIGEEDLAHAIGVQQPTLFDWRMDGMQFRSLARPLSLTPWSYVAALPVATFDAPAREFLRNALIAAAIALLLGSVSALLFARAVSGRLRQVTVAAGGLAQGNLDQQIDARSRDELGQMAAAFQDMIRHQQDMASVATTIASGDLGPDVEPASDRDVLGHAFAGMLRNLRELVARVSLSEERFRSLVQNASDVTTILDDDWRIQFVTPASHRVWGYQADALAGTSALTLVHPDDREAARSFLRDALDRPGTNMTTEMRLRHADGEWRDFEVIATNLLENAAVAGVILTGRDITSTRHSRGSCSNWRSTTR